MNHAEHGTAPEISLWVVATQSLASLRPVVAPWEPVVSEHVIIIQHHVLKPKGRKTWGIQLLETTHDKSIQFNILLHIVRYRLISILFIMWCSKAGPARKGCHPCGKVSGGILASLGVALGAKSASFYIVEDLLGIVTHVVWTTKKRWSIYSHMFIE